MYFTEKKWLMQLLPPQSSRYLQLAPEDPESWVLGSNPKVNRIARHVERAADVECTVLVSGETGTGKELWARLLHRLGPRRDKPFVPVNCAALTATLAESQLFGHEKGAFTGAAGRSLGVFRAAEGGIVFLDEVGEMPLELQPKLLRVLAAARSDARRLLDAGHASTCKSSRPPTAIWSWKWSKAASARTCTIA